MFWGRICARPLVLEFAEGDPEVIGVRVFWGRFVLELAEGDPEVIEARVF